MSYARRIEAMPPAPATWMLADLVAATGVSSAVAKLTVSRSAQLGDIEVVRRGSIHGRAIYRRVPGRPFAKVVKPAAPAPRFVPNSVWALGTMSPSVAD